MSHFDISELENELKDLEAETLKEDFWQDIKHSNKILAKIKIYLYNLFKMLYNVVITSKIKILL